MVAKNGRAKRTPKQKLIEGTHDEIPEEVSDIAEEYCTKLRIRMKAQQAENTLRAQLIEKMTEHKLTELPDPSDDEKVIRLEQGGLSVKIKKRKSAELAEA